MALVIYYHISSFLAIIDITTARQGTDFNVSAIFLRTLRAYQSVDGGFHYGAYLTPGVDWNLLCLR